MLSWTFKLNFCYRTKVGVDCPPKNMGRKEKLVGKERGLYGHVAQLRATPRTRSSVQKAPLHPYLSFWSVRLLSRLLCSFRLPSWNSYLWGRCSVTRLQLLSLEPAAAAEWTLALGPRAGGCSHPLVWWALQPTHLCTDLRAREGAQSGAWNWPRCPRAQGLAGEGKE